MTDIQHECGNAFSVAHSIIKESTRPSAQVVEITNALMKYLFGIESTGCPDGIVGSQVIMNFGEFCSIAVEISFALTASADQLTLYRRRQVFVIDHLCRQLALDGSFLDPGLEKELS